MYKALFLVSIVALAVTSACQTRTPVGDAPDAGTAGTGGPGTAGRLGTAGVTGVAGVSGDAGSGAAGFFDGTAGVTGSAGVSGAAGDSGSAGVTGFAGSGSAGATQPVPAGEMACAAALAAQGTQTAGLFPTEKVLPTMLNSYPTTLVVGDVNGDQKADIAIGNGVVVPVVPNDGAAGTSGGAGFGGTGTPTGMGAVGVYLADAAGGLSAPATYAPFSLGTVTGLALGDVDGDGKVDLVVADGSVRVFANKGGGAFQPNPATYSVGASVNAVALGDVDGDSKTDILVSTQTAGVAVLKNAGAGSFTGRAYPVESGYFAVGDLDGDGKPDVVVSGMSGLHLLLNDGTGALLGAMDSLAPQGTVTLADLNGDGKRDVVVGVGNTVNALFNTGKGVLAIGRKLTDADGGNVAVGDLNGDHNVDLVVPYPTCGAVAVLLNDGAGNFGAPAYTRVTGTPSYAQLGPTVAIGDVNGDGNPDIVVLTDKGTSVLLHAAP